MDVLSQIRPCRLTVVVIETDGALRRSAPHADGMWLFRARLNAEETVAHELAPLLAGLPVRLDVSVKAHGQPSVDLHYDADGCPDLAAVLSDAVARRLHDRVGPAIAAAVALTGPAEPADDAEDRSGCPDCADGVPLPLGYLAAGDRYRAADLPDAAVSTVVAIDADAGLLLVEQGDGPVLVAVDAAGWDAQVVRDA